MSDDLGPPDLRVSMPAALAALPVCTAFVTLDGVITEANPAWRGMLARHGDADGQEAIEALFPGGGGLVGAVIKTGAPGALAAVRTAGRVPASARWWDLDAVRHPENARLAIVTARDATNVVLALREAEDGLREQASADIRLDLLRGAVGVGMWEWEPSTGSHGWSADRFRLLGLQPDAEFAPHDSWMDVVHPDDRPALATALQAATIAASGPRRFEYRIRRPDTGEERWLLSLFRSIPGSRAGSLRLVGVTLDVTDQRSCDQDVLEYEMRLRLAAEAADVHAWDMDLRSGKVTWSPSLARALGYGPDRFDGTYEAFQAIVHPDDLSPVTKAVSDVIAGQGHVYEAEFRMRRADGSWRWTRTRGTVLRDAGGQPIRLIGMDHDITAARAALEELQRKEERLRLAVEASGLGLYEFDIASGRSVWSGAIHAILGTPEDAEPDLAFIASTIHPEDKTAALAAMEAAQRRIGRYELEFRAVRPDGQVRWLVDRGQSIGPLDPSTGKATRLVGAVRDITTKRAAEQEVRQRAEEWRVLLEESPIGVSGSRDRDCRDVWTNAALSRLLRLPDGANASGSAENAAAVPFRMMRHGQVLAPHELPMQRSCASGQPVLNEEIDCVFEDGAVVHLLKSVQPLFHEDGSVRGCIAFNVDVTEHKIREEQLRRSYATYLRLIEQNPFGVYLVDGDFRLAQISQGSRHVFRGIDPLIGRDFAEVLREVWSEPFASDAIALFRHTLATGEPYHARNTTEVRSDEDITESYDWKIERIELPDGSHGVVCYFYDLTERHRYQEQISLLMNEVNHRAKNLLAVVSAVARYTTAETPAEFRQRFDHRIQALAVNQDLLVQSNWEKVELDRLARTQLAHLGDLLDERVVIDGPKLALKPATAQAVGMALHELSTNATKYGSLSGWAGTVQISWQVTPGSAEGGEAGPDQPWSGRFVISWIERGGPPVHPPSRRGFGSTVLQRLARVSLDGTADLNFAPDGVEWRLDCASERALVAPEGG